MVHLALPWGGVARLCFSGDRTVMSALRVARAATNRNRILKFEGCYHGHSDSLLVKAGSGLAGVAASSSAGGSSQGARETLVAPLDDEEALRQPLDEVRKEDGVVIHDAM